MEIDTFTSYDDGLAFAHSFRVLMKKHMQSRMTMDYKDFSLIIPAMVNGAFACELFLKSLFTNEVHGHKLDELLSKLEKEDKKTYDLIVLRCILALKASSNNNTYDDVAFINDLNTNSNLFVEIRYFYEPSLHAKAYNLAFIGVFIGVLEIICESKFGSRPKKTD